MIGVCKGTTAEDSDISGLIWRLKSECQHLNVCHLSLVLDTLHLKQHGPTTPREDVEGSSLLSFPVFYYILLITSYVH